MSESFGYEFLQDDTFLFYLHKADYFVATNLPVFGFSKKQGFCSFGSGCASPKTVHS